MQGAGEERRLVKFSNAWNARVHVRGEKRIISHLVAAAAAEVRMLVGGAEVIRSARRAEPGGESSEAKHGHAPRPRRRDPGDPHEPWSRGQGSRGTAPEQATPCGRGAASCVQLSHVK